MQIILSIIIISLLLAMFYFAWMTIYYLRLYLQNEEATEYMAQFSNEINYNETLDTFIFIDPYLGSFVASEEIPPTPIEYMRQIYNQEAA